MPSPIRSLAAVIHLSSACSLARSLQRRHLDATTARRRQAPPATATATTTTITLTITIERPHRRPATGSSYGALAHSRTRALPTPSDATRPSELAGRGSVDRAAVSGQPRRPSHRHGPIKRVANDAIRRDRPGVLCQLFRLLVYSLVAIDPASIVVTQQSISASSTNTTYTSSSSSSSSSSCFSSPSRSPLDDTST